MMPGDAALDAHGRGDVLVGHVPAVMRLDHDRAPVVEVHTPHEAGVFAEPPHGRDTRAEVLAAPSVELHVVLLERGRRRRQPDFAAPYR
jgi:hypothetical protein